LFERLFGQIIPNLTHTRYLLLKSRANTYWGVHMGGGVANFMAKNGQQVIKKSISVSEITKNIFSGSDKSEQLTLGAFGQFVVFTFCWL
jgi:hypothetical protein